jgi:ribosomal protein S18 acetylase RimI-like enzyme
LTEGIRIRPAREADVPVIRRVAEESWRRTYRDVFSPSEIDAFMEEGYSRSALRSSVAGDGSTVLVAEVGGRVAAFGEAGDRGLGAEIFRLYVEPGQWRRGIGTRLLGALESHLQEEGEESVILYVHRENEIGLSFWRKVGFCRYPEGDREDDPCEACMRKELGTG